MFKFILWIIAVVIWSALIGFLAGIPIGFAYNAAAAAFGFPEISSMAFFALIFAAIFLKRMWSVKINPEIDK